MLGRFLEDLGGILVYHIDKERRKRNKNKYSQKTGNPLKTNEKTQKLKRKTQNRKQKTDNPHCRIRELISVGLENCSIIYEHILEHECKLYWKLMKRTRVYILERTKT